MVLLKDKGKPAEERENDKSLITFEKTTTLVTTGIYHYIRHPLYSSLLLLSWGIFFKDPSIPGITLVTVCSAFLMLTALAEETECTQYFGADYIEYMKKTKRFIPFLI
jgi:protein-S-isoprenylcysteine O-methyltransferase Ste14